MFLWASKALDWILSPLAWALLLALAAALLRRRARLAWGLAALAFAVLAAFSSGAVADGLAAAAERGARTTLRPDVVYDAVVALAGMLDASASRASGETELDAAADRIVRGLEGERKEIHFPAPFSWMVKLMRVLPFPVYERVMKRWVGRVRLRR